MKKEKRIQAIILIAFGSLSPQFANGQQDSLKSFNLDEVVITATKFPKSRSETGKVLTVINAEELQRSAGKDLSQLLNEQVGLVINGANSNPGKDKSVYLRGAKSEYTIFLVDGIPVNDPSGAGGAFDPRMFSIDQLERIEILKGSQSTLYGSDAIAGVINLITKKKGDKKLAGNGTLSVGSYDMLKASGSVQGSGNMIDYHVGYSHTSIVGISEAEDLNNVGGFDRDGFDQNSINANAAIKLTPSFSLSPFLRYTTYDGKFDGGSFQDDNSTYNSTLLNPGLSSQLKLQNGSVNFLYGHNKTDRKFDGPFGATEYKGRFDNADIFFNYDLNKHFQVLTGFNYQNLRMVDPMLAVTEPHAQLVSPYATLFLHNMNGLTLELGGRYNHHSKYGSNTTYSINPSYLLNDHVKIFVNQSTGFKAPTLQQLYGSFGPNENLKPERSISSEAGLQAMYNEKIDVRITVFKRKVEDVIIYTFTNGNINLDKQNDFGFEVEPTVRLNDRVNVKLHYAFVDGEVTTMENGKDSTYFNLFKRPKHNMALNVGVQVNPKFYVSMNCQWVGERKDLFFNPDNFFISEPVALKAYTLLDIYVEHKMLKDRLKFFADAKNILNQDYREVYGYNTLGFNFNTGVSFSF